MFNNNTATSGGGGAVNYSGRGTVTITNSLFSNNNSGSVGGAVNVSGGSPGGTYNIFRSAFVNNAANTSVVGPAFGGGAIASTQGVALNANFNRFTGNTAAGVTNGKTITTGGGTVSTLNANNNWWGVNTGPTANDVLGDAGVIAPSPWLQLRNSASPTTINVAGTSTVTADIFGLNTGGATAASNLTGLPAFPPSGSVFGNAQKGTIPAGSVQFVNGTAGVVFTGTVGGLGGVDAVADSQTITAPITVNAATVPGAPTIGAATPGNGQATIAFTAPASNGGSAITGYTVTCNVGGFTATGAASPLTVTGLTNGTTYTCSVVATNGVGPSAASGTVAVTPATVPGAPTIGAATPGNGQATIAFTAPASNGGSAITGYTVTCNVGGFTATGAASPLTVTGLTNGTTYTCSVVATNGVGPSAASGTVAVTPATVPGAPTIGAATSANGQAIVSFTPSPSNVGAPITSFTVTCTSAALGHSVSATGTASPITVIGLLNGTSYLCSVVANNSTGSSASSAAVAVNLPPLEVPLTTAPLQSLLLGLFAVAALLRRTSRGRAITH